MCYSFCVVKNRKFVLNLSNIDYNAALAGGGKFAGLAKIRPLIDGYVARYNVPLVIPETYAIKIDAPRGVALDAAMCAMDACGGNVAVRSSADVEDAGGKTYSGAFESVLNVQTRDNMKDALDVVYGSAANVPGAKMGVVIQRMIANPDMAGVLYSQDFNGDPYNVVHYTVGRPANFLVVNREKGNLSKISKYHFSSDEGFELFKFSDMNRDYTERCIRSVVFDNMNGMLPLISIKDWGAEKICNLVALANHLECDLGYPVDVEFAIGKDGVINVLQQRPYIINADYIVRHMPNGDFVGYNKGNPIINGVVKIVDGIEDKSIFGADFKDKILLTKDGNSGNGVALLTMVDGKENVLNSKLKIDACYRIHDEMYGHYGNQFREHGTPFWSTQRTADFANVCDGDVMEIDMRSGHFKILRQKVR